MDDFTNNDQNNETPEDMNNQSDMNSSTSDPSTPYGDSSDSSTDASVTSTGITQEDSQSNFDDNTGFNSQEEKDPEPVSDFSEPQDSYASDEAESDKKVIDGFEEATSSMESEIREVNKNEPSDKSWIKKVVAAVVVVLVLFGMVKMCTGRTPREYDDSMVLVMNQTQVSPEKIAVYIKTVYGVDEPVIRIPGVLKEEFSATNVDEEKNVVTWFWTVEGKRAQKSFNKQAELRIELGKDKYYEQEFTLDKEIRIDFQN